MVDRLARRSFLQGAALVPLAIATEAAPARPIDPALVALAEFEVAALACRNGPEDDDASEPLWNEREQKLQALGRVTPTTTQGAIALMKALMAEEGNFIDANSPICGAINNLLAFIAAGGATEIS